MSLNAPTRKVESNRENGTAAPFSIAAAATKDAVDRARRRIAPLWPLRSYVAVNPFMGVAEHDFESAARVMARRAGARMTAPRAFYAAALENGRITRHDLAAALAEGEVPAGAPTTVAELEAFARRAPAHAPFQRLPTVADVAHEVNGKAWPALVTESISRWASCYFDQGQAYWKSPWRHLAPYAAWRAEAELDRTPEVAGVRDFRRTVANLPESANDTIAAAVELLDVPAGGVEPYLHRLLMSIGGWAGYARYRLWEAELRGGSDGTIDEVLAIRLAWEVALLEGVSNGSLTAAWATRREELASPDIDAAVAAELAGDLLLQNAFDKAHQRRLIDTISAAESIPPTARPRVQAAFCIDVRSEVYRRALESVGDGVETLGFAGFFGFPIEYVRLGEEKGGAQCPALLTPQFVIREGLAGATEEEDEAVSEQRDLRRRAAKAWRLFKFGAVSCFGFVGPVGLLYLKNLVTDTLGWTRPVPAPATYGLDDDTARRLAPRIEPEEKKGRRTGMAPDQRLEVAEGVLRAMSLTDNFARIVLLAGHGSTTVNNPYATGLDCGACGGHTGEANARVAAAVLNDPDVRSGLGRRGIDIPADTRFVAALHDTTTDRVAILDRDHIPVSHTADITQLERDLAAAGRIARIERAPLLNLAGASDVDGKIMARSRDWSQVRPEWGLAGCAAFVVAPRHRTRNLDLGGRTFLHSYEWQNDKGFGVLELIMTAPMVVAGWINLQYYGSTVDNQVFGSGNKVLHNVVGTLGVLEGNGGDLRVGLPWQSLHDGEKYIHEPLRLTVIIEAPVAAMTRVIEKHAGVRQLLDNRWLILFALDEEGRVSHRYAGGLRWERVL